MLDTPSSDVVGERMEPMRRRTQHREYDDDDDDELESRNALLTSASLPFVDVGRSNKPSRPALHQVRSKYVHVGSFHIG